MPKGSTQIYCGHCIVPPDVPKNAKLTDEVVCPQCSQRDTVKRVLSQARVHATHLAARELEQKRRENGDLVRSFTPTRAPIKALRWITGASD